MPVPSGDKPFVTATLKLRGGFCALPDVTVDGAPTAAADAELEDVTARLQLARTIQSVHEAAKADDLAGAQRAVGSFVSAFGSSTDERVKPMVEDAKGQVSEAASKKEWFQKWGRHYLPSLANAHMMQQCSNFKDPGVQRYGSKLFSERVCFGTKDINTAVASDLLDVHGIGTVVAQRIIDGRPSQGYQDWAHVSITVYGFGESKKVALKQAGWTVGKT